MLPQQTPFRWAARSLRERGMQRTVLAAWGFVTNWCFDIRYGTNTAPVVELCDLEITSSNKEFGHESRSSKAQPIRRLLSSLDFPPDSVFIDFGSGKGKVLLVASEFPFKKVIEVEFSSKLCDVARSNAAKYTRGRSAPEIELHPLDAVDYQFTDEENVFYFSDPFGENVLECVVDAIEKSLERAPHPIWIIYHAPDHREVFDRRTFLNSPMYLTLAGADCLVYQNDYSLRGDW